MMKTTSGHSLNLHALRRIAGIAFAVILATVAAYIQMSGSLTGAVIKAPKQSDLMLNRWSTPSVLSNEPVMMEYEIGNAGPETVKKLKIEEDWTPGFAVVSQVAERNNTTVSCRNLQGKLVCSVNVKDGLPGGESLMVRVGLRTHAPKDPAPCGRTYEFSTASVRHDAPGFIDQNEDNNLTATTFTNVDCSDITAEVSIYTDDSPDPAPVSGTMTYRLTVGNNGPARTRKMKIRHKYEAGLRYTGSSVGRCTHSAKNREIICDPGDDEMLSQGILEPGQSVQIDLSFTVPQEKACGSVASDTVVVIPQTGINALLDPNPENNVTGLQTAVDCPPAE